MEDPAEASAVSILRQPFSPEFSPNQVTLLKRLPATPCNACLKIKSAKTLALWPLGSQWRRFRAPRPASAPSTSRLDFCCGVHATLPQPPLCSDSSKAVADNKTEASVAGRLDLALAFAEKLQSCHGETGQVGRSLHRPLVGDLSVNPYQLQPDHA